MNCKKLEYTFKKLRTYLRKFEKLEYPTVSLEQYETPLHILEDLAKIILEDFKKVKSLKAADFGAGTGRITLLLYLLGFKKIYAIEKDKKAFIILFNNIFKILKASDEKVVLLNQDVRFFNENVDVVVSNPPFGVKKRGQDRVFIKKACELANVSYMIGNYVSIDFYKKYVESFGRRFIPLKVYDFPIKKKSKFHKVKEKIIKVLLYKIE